MRPLVPLGRRASAALTTLVNGAPAASCAQGDSLTFEGFGPTQHWGADLTLVVDGVDGPTLTAADLRAGAALNAPAFTSSLRARLGSGAGAVMGRIIGRAPQAPAFTTPPAFDAATYAAGATVTLSEGIATGSPAPTITLEYFELDGVDISAELTGLAWDSTGAPAGTLRARFRAANSLGAVLSAEITATLQAATLADQTAMFGSATPAGAGGWQPFDSSGQPQPLASVSATGTRTWSISGGRLVADGTPDVDTGATMSVTTVGGATLTATIDATTVGEAVATAAELQALIDAGGARLDGKTVLLRGGVDYDMSAYSWPAQSGLTNPVTYRPERTDVAKAKLIGPWVLPGGAGNLTIDGLALFMAAEGANSLSFGEGRGVIDGTGGSYSNITIRNCKIYSDLIPAAEGGYLVEQNYGIRLQRDGCTNILIENNEIHNVGSPIQLQIANATVRGNTSHDFWVDGVVLNGTNGVVENVLFENNHTHTPIGFYELVHQDFFQFQPPVYASNAMRNITIRGGTYAPGNMLALCRPGDNMRSGPPTIDVTTETLVPATHLGRQMRVLAGATATVFDPSTAPGAVLWLTGRDSTAGSYAIPNLHPEVGTSPISFAIGQTLTLRSDGTQWRAVEPGLRAGVNHIAADYTAQVWDNTFCMLADTRTAPITITLSDDPALTAIKVGLLKPSANGVTVVASGDDTLEVGGSTVASVVITSMQDVRKFEKSGNVWTVGTTNISVQGFPFGNAHPDELYSNIVSEYNAGFVLSTQGLNLQGNSDITYRYDTVMPVLPANVETALLIPNLALGAALPDAYGNVVAGVITGEAGERVNNYERGIISSSTVEQARAAMDDMFAVSTFAEFTPTTRAEVVAALTPRAGGPLDGTGQGAVGRYDFTVGAIITPVPAPDYVSITPANGQTGQAVDGNVVVAFDQPVAAGAGNFVLWDVAGNLAAATIAVGSTTIAYNRVTVPYSGLSNLKEYELRWDAGVILGADGQAVAALGAGVHSFTTKSAVPPSYASVLSQVFAAGGNGGASDLYETNSLTPTGKRLIVFVHLRGNTSTDRTGTLTIGTAGRAYGTGTAATLLSRQNRSFATTFAFEIASPGTTAQTIQLDLDGGGNGCKFEVYEITGSSGIGAVANTGNANIVSIAPGLTTLGADSLILYAATLLLDEAMSVTAPDTALYGATGVTINAATHAQAAAETAAAAGTAVSATISWTSSTTATAVAVEIKS